MKATTTPPASSDHTTPASAALNKAAQDAREMVDKIAGAVDEAARKAIPAAAQVARNAVDSVAASAAPAAAWLDDHADELNATHEALLTDARRYIRENPLQSVAIALTVGFLINRIAR